MQRRDPALLVALCLLGVVVVAIGAIAAVRINAEGGLDALGRDPEYPRFAANQDDCLDLAEGLATGGNPWEGEIRTRDDGFTETINGVERGWSVHESTYTNRGAARSAFDSLKLAQSPEMKTCFMEELDILEFPGVVEDGYGTGERALDDGETGQVYYAVWQDAERLVSFTAYSTSSADISAWVRQEYERVRTEWD